MLAGLLPPYRHPEVASLAWAIGSAPLMSENAGNLPFISENWYDEQFKKHTEWLKELDSEPRPLLEWLQNDAQQLLGKRFESLLAFWFSESPFFQLIQRNIQFRSLKNTSGEVDFIVKDTETRELLHIEVACKYYIGLENSNQWKNWIGPNGRDSLLLKMEKLKQQSSVFSNPSGIDFLVTNGLDHPTTLVFMKGCFFHHYSRIATATAPKHAHPHYTPGWYIRESELHNLENSPAQ